MHTRSHQSQGGLRRASCVGLSQVANLRRQLCILKLFKFSAPIHRICSHGVCDLHSASASSMEFQVRLSAAADPMKVMSSCRPILVIWRGANSSDLERANSKPEHEHTLHGSLSLPSVSRRSVHSPSIVASLPEPRVAGLPCGSHKSQQAEGKHSSSLPSTLIEKLCCRRFRGQLVALHLRPVPAWVPSPCRSPSPELSAQSVLPGPACQAPSSWVQLL